MSSSQSMEALSDPLPRLYSCFCEKIFTTYPGIYLHLKSKHSNLFQKYKKLKITKLFKKVKGENNNDVFKLDKICEKDITNNNFSSKKIKQNNKKNAEEQEEKIVLLEENSPQATRKKRSIKTFNEPLDQRPPDAGFSAKPFPSFSREYAERYNYNPYYPPMPNPFFSFSGYPPHPQAYPPFPLHFPPEPTIKRILEEYLASSEYDSYDGKSALRNVLYGLMVFIDQNYPSAKDPRVREGVLLSYCDIFSPKFIGPLINQYISQKMTQGNQDQAAQWEANTLKLFINYLKDRRLLRIQSESRPEYYEQKIDHLQHKPETEPIPASTNTNEQTENPYIS